MSIVKDIVIKVIDSKSANEICKKFHYSGKIVPNSQIHFGAFIDGKCEGVMQFGPSTDKRRMAQNLGVGMNEFLELNRMAFSDALPKNSESRSLAIAIKILKKNYPFLKLILSFADACQCGDGTIYRASGFKLHSFKKNNSLLYLPDEALKEVRKYIPKASNVVSNKSMNDHIVIARKSPDHHTDQNGKHLTSLAKKLGAKPIDGFQMKYIYCIDKTLEDKFKWIPFDKIPKEVKMYKGLRRE